MITTMVYASVYSAATGAGTSLNRFFSGNGLYDPDITGTGHQPYGFDQFCTAPGGSGLYSRYTVMASTFESDNIVITSGSGNPCGTFALRPEGDAGGTTDTIDTLLERSRVKWGVHSNPGAPHPRFIDEASTSEIIGVPASAYSVDDTLQGSYSANPPRQWYWHWCASPSDFAANVSVVHTFRITYTVRFLSRNRLTQS